MSGIILFRIKGQSSNEKITLLKKLLTLYGDKIARHFTVMLQKQYRLKKCFKHEDGRGIYYINRGRLTYFAVRIRPH
jgi:hypothetical protein